MATSGARERGTWAAWLVTRLVGLWLLTGTAGYPAVDLDVFTYHRWQHLLYTGHLPWVSFDVEYPPGVLPAMLIPGGRDVYELAFVALALLVDGLVTGMLVRRSLSRAGWFWVVMPVAVGPIVWVRFDVFVAALLVAAVLFLKDQRWLLSALCIAEATLLKVWPVLLLALLWYYLPETKRRRALAVATTAMALPVLAVVAAGGSGGLLAMLRYQGGRGVEVESAWAAPLAVGHSLFGWQGPESSHHSGEYALQGPYGVLATVALPLALLALGTSLRRRARERELPPVEHVVACLTAVILVTAKTLSAQYVLWAVAATVLVAEGLPRPQWRRLGVVTLLYAAATQYVFPWSWWHLGFNDTQAVVATVLHAELLVVWAAAVFLICRPRHDESPAPWGRASRHPQAVGAA